MRDLLAEALDQGALGLSTGLIYPPLQHADHRELCALAEMVTERDKLFAWHIRDYTDGLLESVAEVLAVARETGCRTQISHLMSVGRRNRGVVGEALAMIDRARADGLDIGVDIYPYLAGNAPLAQLLPGWLPVGGQRAVLLRDPATRQRIAAEWEHNPVGWDEIMICAMPGEDQSLVGRILDESAAELGRPAAELALDLLAEHDNAVMMVAFGRAEEDLRQVLAHPATVVASDGQAAYPIRAASAAFPAISANSRPIWSRGYAAARRRPRIGSDWIAAGSRWVRSRIWWCSIRSGSPTGPASPGHGWSRRGSSWCWSAAGRWRPMRNRGAEQEQ